MQNEENKIAGKETTKSDTLSAESMDMNEGDTSNGTIGGTGSDLDALEKDDDNKGKNNLPEEDKS